MKKIIGSIAAALVLIGMSASPSLATATEHGKNCHTLTSPNGAKSVKTCSSIFENPAIQGDPVWVKAYANGGAAGTSMPYFVTLTSQYSTEDQDHSVCRKEVGGTIHHNCDTGADGMFDADDIFGPNPDNTNSVIGPHVDFFYRWCGVSSYSYVHVYWTQPDWNAGQYVVDAVGSDEWNTFPDCNIHNP